MPAPNDTSAEQWTPRHSAWLIAVAVMLATFMEVLDTSVANVSLPHIAGTLSATTDEATWVLTSYLVANAIVLPAASWFGNLFGRKRFLIACVLLFTFGSALCGMAQSLGFLVIARVFQGAGGGALQPISQAILLESFPPQKRGAAMAVFVMGVVVAPILGPTLGGWLTDNYSWRWIFYINLPIGIGAVFLINALVDDPPYLKRISGENIDFLGLGLLAIWLATMQYVLDRGQELDWFGSRAILFSTIISAIAFVAFIIRQLRAEQPIVDLCVWRNRNFAVGSSMVLFVGALLYGTIAVLPLFMQNLLGYTALDAGIALAPRGIGAFFGTLIIGRISGRVSNRILIAAGFLLLTYSSFMFGGINLDISMRNIIVPSVLNGFAISLIFVPLTTATMGTLAREQIGNATGIFNLMRNLGGSIGIASITTFVARMAQSNQNVLSAHTSEFNPLFQQRLAELQSILSHKVGAWEATRQARGILYRILSQQAELTSYIHNFRFVGIVCLVCVPMVLLFKKVSGSKTEAAAH
jgi:DHA2 family multidrug resistance protein